MLDKILYVVSKNDMPLKLLQSVLPPFLQIGTVIDSSTRQAVPPYSNRNNTFYVSQQIVLPRALIISDEI